MSKNLKKIVALAMVIGTISVAAPAISNTNFLITKAYASSDENDNDTFDSLKLETSDGSSIRLYDDDSYDSDNKVDSGDVKEDTDYYAKTSSNTIHIDIDGVSSKYVRVFRKDGDDGISDSTKGKKVSSDVSLSSGKNTIVVRIYDEEPDDNPRYDDDSDKSNDYTIYVKCTGDDSSDSSDDSSDNYDDIYLKSLSINGDSVSLSDSQTTYTYNVASNIDSVPIKAKPDDSDYTVEIDGDEVDDSDNYKRDVDLNKGENDIKVKLTDEDDNERDYTLKITRADNTAAASTGTSTAASQTSTATAVTNGKVGWVQVNGGWQYNDSIGTPLKSQWIFDRNYGKWYYLGTDGMMAHDTYIGKWRVGSDGAWIS
ncbi:cadherin-like beta sandwich domain-containing protein [Clostridium sp. BL-8]|uniref:cadherin-like beta sandwich domain-containing protein n=1 Tax=Clostridium sp. BL-8 TaxID=349938 RepID=UPI00098CE975|nr:cadherin-like beta sandwich domain-containing protein [Clostridium sp. BL-8]OOM71289.1 cadherin-like beta sandwich domain protein [Clostridium sp. BL-8]